ncbi:UNKNOWN [Stylonychia lemnae]|uniref:Uncharacterized protein n=1 Tax=Stylonychia lemnae TaxID=5949 RepID=A0A078AUK4_STYLE|nr:UNKNOWN [Stylonychia lemnae]|eukprot:CDW85701.1 UNKNOWN [Stylonychia lemnae]
MLEKKKDDLQDSLISNAYKGLQTNQSRLDKSKINEKASSNVFIDGLYGFFKVKMGPGKKSKTPKVLQYTYELGSRFENFFMDFDAAVIDFIQGVHLKGDSTRCRFLQFLFAFISIIFSYFYALELWVVLILNLNLYQEDSTAVIRLLILFTLQIRITHMLLLNIIITQMFKRFVLRMRPQYQSGSRSLVLVGQRSSSIPSRIVIAAPTLTFALLNSDLMQLRDNLGAIIGICVGVYILASIIRVLQQLKIFYRFILVLAFLVIALLLYQQYFIFKVQRFLDNWNNKSKLFIGDGLNEFKMHLIMWKRYLLFIELIRLNNYRQFLSI